MRHLRSLSLLAPALATVLVVGACSSDGPAEPPAPSEGASAKLVEVSPLTGEPMEGGQPDNPVFVVKIENTANGAPQVGLDQADLVVEELVEGGLTRLAAMFHSELPRTVGHVRSLRATDIGIAAPVAGQLVASGGSGGTIRKVERAGVEVFSEDDGAPGFSSDPAKVRPYNRLVDLRKVDRRAKVTDVPGPYLAFTPEDGASATPSAEPSASAAPTPKKVERASVRFSRSSTTSWKLAGRKWKRTNGHADREFAADTVVAMFCDVGQAGYLDPAGNPVPETKVRGSGRAVLLTADGALETTWTKKSNDDTITFEAKDGTPVTIDPGKVWIELVPKGDGAIDLDR